MESVNRAKLIGIQSDGRLNFDYHLSQLCKMQAKNYTLEFVSIWTKKTKDIYESFCKVTLFILSFKGTLMQI